MISPQRLFTISKIEIKYCKSPAEDPTDLYGQSGRSCCSCSKNRCLALMLNGQWGSWEKPTFMEKEKHECMLANAQLCTTNAQQILSLELFCTCWISSRHHLVDQRLSFREFNSQLTTLKHGPVERIDSCHGFFFPFHVHKSIADVWT